MAEAARLFVKIGADIDGALKGMATVGDRMAGLAGTAAKVGAGIGAAFGGLAVAGIGMAVNAAAGFEQTMSGIAAVSGATADELGKLSGLALQLGKDTSFSAKEAASGIEELLKGGVAIGDVMGGAAQSMLDLAAAGGVSLPESAEIAANALAMFSLKGADMAHVADLIAGAANASSLSVSDFKFSMAAAGAIAAQTGQRFDDLAEAIAIMGQAGLKGSDAGTSLKTFLMGLQPTTKAATGAMRDLGIITADGTNAFINANGSFKGMVEIAGILNEKTRSLTDSQKLMALETIFGSDAIRAAAIFAKAGADGFTDMSKAMGKVTAASVAAKRLDNVTGSMEQMKGSIETAQIALGTAFLPVLRQGIDGLTGLVNAAIPWIETKGPGLAASLQGIAAQGLALAGAIGTVAGPIIQTALGGDVVGATMAATQAFKGLFPTTAGIIDTLVALGSTALDLGSKALPVVLGGITGTVRAVQSLWPDPLQPLATGITAFGAAAIEAGGKALPRLTSAAEGVGKTLAQLWPDPLNGIVTTISAFGQGALALADQGLPRMGEAVTSGFVTLTGFLSVLNENSTALSVLSGVVGAVATAWGLAAAASAAHTIAMGAQTVATGLLTAAQGALNLVMTANPIGLVIVALGGLAAAFITAYKTSEDFRSTVDRVFGAFKDTATAAIGIVVGRFEELYRSIKTILDALGAVGRWAGILPTGITVGAQTPMPPVGALAEGGVVRRSGIAMVGERGPEILMLPRAATVAPLGADSLPMGGGDVTITIGDIYVQGDVRSRADAEHLAERVAEIIERRVTTRAYGLAFSPGRLG